MCPALVSGIITGDAPVSYWPFFFTNFKEQTQESPSYLACSFPSIFSPFFPFFVSFVFAFMFSINIWRFLLFLLEKAHVV